MVFEACVVCCVFVVGGWIIHTTSFRMNDWHCNFYDFLLVSDDKHDRHRLLTAFESSGEEQGGS